MTSAQGWSPFPTPEGMAAGLKTAAITDIGELERRLVRARELCEEHGRVEPLTICFVPFGLPDYLADPVGRLGALTEEIAALGEIGVDWVALMAPGNTRAELLDSAAALAGALGLS